MILCAIVQPGEWSLILHRAQMPDIASMAPCHGKGADIFKGHGQDGACVMEVQLTATCPKTLSVTLGDVLESGNAKNCVNLA